TYNTNGTRATETDHNPAGNTAQDTTTTYTYPAATAAQPHSLTGTSAVTGGTGTPVVENYGYDTSGNTTGRQRKPSGTQSSDQLLDWDAEGKLKKVTDTVRTTSGSTTTTATRTADYLYDAGGNRLIGHSLDSATPAAESWTLYLGNTELNLVKGATKPSANRYYTLGPATAVRTDDNKVTFQINDHHNTAELNVDATTGALTQRRATVFGAARGTGPTAWAGSRGFLGGVTEPTGLTHLGARDYDPATGRFISVDPLLEADKPQTLNAYVYSANNPVTFSDPTGEAFEECVNGMYSCRGGTEIIDQGTRYDEVVAENKRAEAYQHQSVLKEQHRQELGRRAAAAYRSGGNFDANTVLNPEAPQIVAMWFAGITPDAYYFDQEDKFTAGVQQHIWMDTVRKYLQMREGSKLGETITGLDYKTLYGAKLNNIPLKVLMAGELADFAAYLNGNKDTDSVEGATRAILGSFNLEATISGYDSATKTAKVDFELTNKMTVESLTRGVSEDGYTSGTKEGPAVMLSDTLGSVFPGGQRALKFTVSWSESINMSVDH
ncbi:RHS repeat-associated core domain-containing protein, partial [Kitasatospora sp. NPDC049258]|uniref:RHS repeat-associated core domain-containing protein n=1 Tax=Kitasatospora sp. NPDC049258 TaxID=3155394 RepID=UPI00342487EF